MAGVPDVCIEEGLIQTADQRGSAIFVSLGEPETALGEE